MCTSYVAIEICDWVLVGTDVYMTNCKYQVMPHSSPWFSVAFTAVIVYRNHFFCLCRRINLLHLKWSSDRLVIIPKGFLKLPNLVVTCANKIKESIISQKLGSLHASLLIKWACFWKLYKFDDMQGVIQARMEVRVIDFRILREIPNSIVIIF